MWALWMALGVAMGAVGLWLALAFLVARRLGDDRGLREKVRVGEKMVAVVIGGNGDRRKME